MHYQLREGLSCCDVGGHMIFLDTAQDRYFKLIGPLEKAMRGFQVHGDVAPMPVDGLVTARILVEASGPKARAAIANICPPARSAIEQSATTPDHRPSPAIVFELMATIWSTRRHLKSRTLKTNLDEASAYRDRKAGALGVAAATALEEKLLQANWQFAHARPYVPIEPTCLLDSLSLLRFLSRRGLPATLIFGVMSEPFAAHCWVQVGDIVLNETLSDANAHTPIRMI